MSKNFFIYEIVQTEKISAKYLMGFLTDVEVEHRKAHFQLKAAIQKLPKDVLNGFVRKSSGPKTKF